MERTELFDIMGALKLYGMRASYDEIMATAIKREHEPPRIVVVFGERHLRYILLSYMEYYNGARTHLSLNKNAPIPRAVQTVERILPTSILGGLHHHYVRI